LEIDNEFKEFMTEENKKILEFTRTKQEMDDFLMNDLDLELLED
jgi:hypothetical protein